MINSLFDQSGEEQFKKLEIDIVKFLQMDKAKWDTIDELIASLSGKNIQDEPTKKGTP